MKFELSGLDSYDDDSLLAELRRVAVLLGTKTLTRAQFDAHAKASESLVRRRFGGWANALLRAGLEAKASPKAGRVLAHGSQTFTDDEMIAELRYVAEKLKRKTITIEDFNGSSPNRVGDFRLISDQIEHAGEDLEGQILFVA